MIATEIYYETVQDLLEFDHILFNDLFIIETSNDIVSLNNINKNKIDSDYHNNTSTNNIKEKIKLALEKIKQTILDIIVKIKQSMKKLKNIIIDKFRSLMMTLDKFMAYYMKIISLGTFKPFYYHGRGIKISPKMYQKITNIKELNKNLDKNGKLFNSILNATSEKDLNEIHIDQELINNISSYYGININNINELEKTLENLIFHNKEKTKIYITFKSFGINDLINTYNSTVNDAMDFLDKESMKPGSSQKDLTDSAKNTVQQLKNKIEKEEDINKIKLYNLKANYLYKYYTTLARYIFFLSKVIININVKVGKELSTICKESDKYKRK